MGSLSLIIVLILIVWIIVLAPMLSGGVKKIRRSGEGYEETRVLHEGGSEPVVSRRRPKLTAADVHQHAASDDDVELVEAEDEQVLIDDAPPLRSIFRKDVAATEETPVVIDAEPVEDAEDAENTENGDRTVEAVETEDAAAEGGSTRVELDTEDSACSEDSADSADSADEERYELREAYESPADFGYVDEVDEVDEAEKAESSRTEVEAPAVQASVGADALEPDDSDIAFAKTRRGRGGYDPERERAARAERFRRRQRTFLGLIVLFVAAFVLAFVAGGWTWVLPAIAVALNVWFFIAARGAVRKERALHQRRVRQLRRARMGVDLAQRPQSAPGERRRIGSVILDLDEEHPDFESLPSYRREPEYDDYSDDRRHYTPRAS